MQQIVPAITDETRFTLTALGMAALAQAKASTPTMNADELRSFLNETTQDDRRARTLANIGKRALTLFADGYTITNRRVGQYDTAFTVRSPKGDFYGVCVETESAFGDFCNCKAFAEWETCKHLQACQRLLDEEAAIEAQEEQASIAADYYDEWALSQGF